jgi:hypothetical protein
MGRAYQRGRDQLRRKSLDELERAVSNDSLSLFHMEN